MGVYENAGPVVMAAKAAVLRAGDEDFPRKFAVVSGGPLSLPSGPTRAGVFRVARTDDAIEVEGTVVEPLPNAVFRVKLGNGHDVLCHIAEKMRMHYIRILPGDRVRLAMSPYDLERGRITYRYR